LDGHQIISTVRAFLKFVDSPPADAAERDQRLLRHLDSLAHSQHHVAFTFDDRDYPDPPNLADKLRDRIARRFPDFGHYNTPEYLETNVGESPCIVGDAIDDIHDIVSELLEVEWRWSNTSSADALFHFEFTYGSHWQYHLRWLQVYLVERQYEA